MSKKIYINESQMELITNYLQSNKSVEKLDEGFKEIALSIALLAGLNIGANKALAQQGLSNSDAKAKMVQTLDDSEKLNKVISSLESVGFEDAEALIRNNADEIKKKLTLGNNKAYVRGVEDVEDLAKYLSDGYSVYDVKTDTLTSIVDSDDTLEVSDVFSIMEIELPSDKLFKTGGYDLGSEGVKYLDSIISEIENDGSLVTGVRVESSTDKEPIRSMITKSDPTGNIRLSNLRINSVKDVLVRGGVNPDKITECPLPNNPNSSEFSRDMSDEERQQARNESKGSRYVKVVIEVTNPVDEFKGKDSKQVSVKEVVTKFKLIKTKVGSPSKKRKSKKYRPKKNKKDSPSTECPDKSRFH